MYVEIRREGVQVQRLIAFRVGQNSRSKREFNNVKISMRISMRILTYIYRRNTFSSVRVNCKNANYESR